MSPRPVTVIGIAGASGSGKTTLADALAQHLGPAACVRISQDSYYHDQSDRFDHDGGKVNFDEPAALDFERLSAHLEALAAGHEVEIPVYDFVEHRRAPQGLALTPQPWILVDGTLILADADVRERLDLAVFVRARLDCCLARRIDRDLRERGRTREGVVQQWQTQVLPMYAAHVESSARHADLEVDGQAPVHEGVAAVMTMIESRGGRRQ